METLDISVQTECYQSGSSHVLSILKTSTNYFMSVWHYFIAFSKSS